MKDTVRLSFDVPVEEHIMREYKKAKFHERMNESFQQAYEGKGREISNEELDAMEKLLGDD